MKTISIGTFCVISDVKRVRRIKLNCACGHAWIELIAGELEASELIVRFQCPRCAKHLYLQNCKMIKFNEEDTTHDAGQHKTTQQYDA